MHSLQHMQNENEIPSSKLASFAAPSKSLNANARYILGDISNTRFQSNYFGTINAKLNSSATINFSHQSNGDEMSSDDEEMDMDSVLESPLSFNSTSKILADFVSTTCDQEEDATTENALNRLMFYRVQERFNRPIENYFDTRQHNINTRMRSILVDWLHEVAMEFSLCIQTIEKCVNLLDRYLSVASIQRNQLQLVGVACLLIASKYEEVTPPSIEDFTWVTDNSYTREQVLDMEACILSKLGFRLNIVTISDVLHSLQQAMQADGVTVQLAQYLSELTLQEYSFTKYLPSMVATSAFCLAMHTLRMPAWNSTMKFFMKYEANELTSCVNEMLMMHRHIAEATSMTTLRDKYASPVFNRVSAFTPAQTAPNFNLHVGH